MSGQRFWRQVHYWGSLLILLPFGVVVVTGLMLMLKKDLSWIQPPTQTGVVADVAPTLSLGELFDVARTVPELELEDWTDLKRVDVKVDRGVIMFVALNDWEAQIDTKTREVLDVAYRRSDIIEALHDGSFFSAEVKRYVFLPSGVVLFVLWLTGTYLFILPQAKRLQKRRRSR
ncbi:PepSY domain-containing protein [Sphingoaurantiacus capsulatus]|uniref:PepSY domain-containing protein n=1 Tax=Sphingoaurantiacus capsulatus TaxID=1771310 RepID=A0ABV7XA21_9SPHN